MEAPLAGARGSHRAVLLALLIVFLVLPGVARAAEVDVRHDVPGVIEVHQGETAFFTLLADASGSISCFTTPSNPATLTVATNYAIAGDGVASSGVPSGALPFYRRPGLPILLPPGQCNVAWNGFPAPYRVLAKVATASTTPAGDYQLRVGTTTTNPSNPLDGSLQDGQPSAVAVRVLPQRTPPVLPDPHENRSINLFPLVGTVRIRFQGTTNFVPLRNPIQVRVGSELDLSRGHVELVSDRDGRGDAQSAEFWDGFAKVGYTRKLVPGSRSGGSSSTPITELKLSRPLDLGCASSHSAGHSRVHSSRRRHRRRRRLWGRGHGRYRSRSRYGAATVRGTQWLSEEGCTGSRFTVRQGTVSVRDFVTHRSVNVHPGQSYFIEKPNRSRGRSVG